MKTLFVTRSDDAVGVLALQLLEQCGQTTAVLQNGEGAPPSSIGIFGFDGDVRNRYLRLSKHRMVQEGIVPPVWCADMAFCTAVSAPNARANPFGLKQALRDMLENYRKWGPWMTHPEAPWNPNWQHGSPHPEFALWHAKAAETLSGTPCVERLVHRVNPIFTSHSTTKVTQLIVTGCALFNRPHTDVVDTLPAWKVEIILNTLASVISESGVRDVRFIVPRGDLVCDVLKDHFHPFMFMDLGEVEGHINEPKLYLRRLFGDEHAHARSDAEVARALDRSGDGLVRDVLVPLSAASESDVQETTWTEYIGPYIERAHMLALKYRSEAESIYMARVKTRPSYASLHKIDPARGLRRTISNNVFYLSEAMYLRDHPETAVVNCEYADTFWRGLESVLEKEVWGSFRPLIGMVPEPARQPWAY